jgi:uncharacterized protein with HEPN domain
MRGPLSDLLRADHILSAISEVEKYLAGVSFEDFLSNSEKRFATIKQIEIVGEACKNISPGIKENHPEVAWKSINGFRNISIHEYFDVGFDVVWEIATNDLPILKEQFELINKELSDIEDVE